MLSKKRVLEGCVTVGLGLVIGIASSWGARGLLIVWMLPLIVASIWLVNRYTEVSYFFFLFAVVFKSDARLGFITNHVDLTLLFLLLALVGIVKTLVVPALWPRLHPRLVWPVIGLMIMMGISLTYSSSQIYGPDKFMKFAVLTLSSILIPLFIFHSLEKLKGFYHMLLVLIMIMLTNSFMTGNFRSAFGSNYLLYGKVAGMAIITIIYYFLPAAKTWWAKLCYCVILVLALFGLFLSGGRGPVLGLGLALMFTTGYSLFRKDQHASRQLIKKGLAMFAGVGIFVYIFREKIGVFLNRFLVLFADHMGGSSVRTRLFYYGKAWEAFTSHFIGGLGLGEFGNYVKGLDVRLYPHNLFLEVSAELGIMGLFFVTWLLWGAVRTIGTEFRHGTGADAHHINVAMTILVFLLLNALVSGDLNDNRLLFSWIGVVYAIYNCRRQITHEPVTTTIEPRESIYESR